MQGLVQVSVFQGVQQSGGEGRVMTKRGVIIRNDEKERIRMTRSEGLAMTKRGATAIQPALLTLNRVESLIIAFVWGGVVILK